MFTRFSKSDIAAVGGAARLVYLGSRSAARVAGVVPAQYNSLTQEPNLAVGSWLTYGMFLSLCLSHSLLLLSKLVLM